MAKKITIFIVSLCIFLISAIPVYADYQVPFDTISISKGYGWSNDYHTVCISNDYYYIIPNNNRGDSSGYYMTLSGSNLIIQRQGNYINSPVVYRVARSNPYGEWVKLNDSNGYYGNGSGVSWDNCYIAYSGVDIYNNAGDLVFQRAPLGTQTTPEGGTIQDNSILSQNLSKSSLQNVLNELIACLPILFPVLITLIAIRKGLSFTLMILKTS